MSQGFYGFPNILGLLRATNLRVTGKVGATAGAGLAGGTISGAPVAPAGPFDVGDVIPDATGKLWICTTAGTSQSSPGAFTQVGGAASPLTTKGDVWVYGSADSRLGVGSDTQVLTADSAQSLGVKWATPAASGGGGQAVEHLAYTLSSDTSVNGSNAAFVDFITNQSFTIDLSTSTVMILVECSILVNISTGSQINQLRVVLDSAGTPINRQVCGGITDPNGHAILSGGTTVVTGLSVGSHTVKLQALINGGALNPTFTCNPATLPNLYFLRIIVLEFE